MSADPLHPRKRLRISGHDYADPGWYFVTICVQDRAELLGTIIDGAVVLSPAGTMVAEHWRSIPDLFPLVGIDHFVVMPNHLHGIVILGDSEHSAASLPDVIGTFKSLTTRAYGVAVRNHGWLPFNRKFWQRSYYDQLIRGDRHYEHVWNYIEANPGKWAEDEENPQVELSLTKG